MYFVNRVKVYYEQKNYNYNNIINIKYVLILLTINYI